MCLQESAREGAAPSAPSHHGRIYATAAGGPSVLVLRSLGEGVCSANVPVEMLASNHFQVIETMTSATKPF